MKVLFFAPNAGVWPHAYPEALVADAVRSAGVDLVYVTCDGAFRTGCVTMAALGVGEAASAKQREAVCRDCRRARDHLRRGFRFGGYDLDRVLDAADEARIAQILDGVDRDAIVELVVDEIPIGRAALYEFLIERKKLQLTLTSDEWASFRPRLANVLRSLLAAAKILDRENPDRIVVYNSLYATNAAWRLVASARGIPFYFVHGGLSLHERLQYVLVGRDTTLAWWARAVAAWPRYSDEPCSPAELALVSEHFLHLFRGTSVFAYSAAKSAAFVDVRARFGVRADQKLLVASMSSYDEYVAAAAVGGAPDPKSMLFPTQLDWTRALIEWATHHPDRFVLLRVHPREFPNKREGRKSEHATALEQALAVLPPNVRVNWPSDALSIYDVAEQADVFLNGWSSAGREMAVLGLPVVTYCPEALLYPPDLNFVGTTRETYFAAIEEALAAGWSFERIRRAYRWCVLELVRGLFHIGDAFDWVEDPPRTLAHRIRHVILSQPAIRQRYDLLRRPRQLAAARQISTLVTSGRETVMDLDTRHTRVSLEVETEALRRELRRLVTALYGDVRARPGTLHAKLERAATAAP